MYASILIIFFLFCSSYFRLLVYFSYLIFVYLFFFFLFFFDFFFFFFFFSSRRRHTRLTCDRSSDVCSSDLPDIPRPILESMAHTMLNGTLMVVFQRRCLECVSTRCQTPDTGERYISPSSDTQKKIGRASCRERV